MSRTNNPTVRKEKTVKPKSKDPRPKIEDFPNREAYRQAVLKWRVRNGFAKAPKPKEKKKYVSPYERKHGKKQKSSKDLKVKKESYAKDRVGKVDLNSKEYKEAKKINEQTTSTPIKRLSKEEREKHKEIAKSERLKIKKDEANKKGAEKAKNSNTTGGPVKDGVKYARSKGDDLAGYRRGEGTKLGKDTKITKSLKKAGFTEDRLARLRKKNAEFQSIKKIKDRKERKKKMEEYRSKYG